MVAETKLTYEDYIRFPEDGTRREIMDGEIFTFSPPGAAHQRVLGSILDRIGAHAKERELGNVYSAPYAVILGPHDIVEPDCVFVANARNGIVGPKVITGAPDLCVEVASPPTQRRDRTVKADRYAQFGVLEYWIADPATRRIETFALERGAYLPLGIFGKNALVVSYVLPDLDLPASIFFPAS